MSKAGSKLIKSANQALAYARGESSDGFTVHVPEEIDVKSIRKSLGLTHPEFSSRFGFDVRAVQDWEQTRSQPDRAARILLTVISREPEAVGRALAHGRGWMLCSITLYRLKLLFGRSVGTTQ